MFIAHQAVGPVLAVDIDDVGPTPTPLDTPVPLARVREQAPVQCAQQAQHVIVPPRVKLHPEPTNVVCQQPTHHTHTLSHTNITNHPLARRC